MIYLAEPGSLAVAHLNIGTIVGNGDFANPVITSASPC
jgi:hypothetical protein